MTTDELIADRNRWRHEYRIEKQKNALMRAELRRVIAFTDKEREALTTFVAALVNDEGFDTYGLSGMEQAAVRRALAKLSHAR
jgi:hypothetical protein